jgi:hypothetical protein
MNEDQKTFLINEYSKLNDFMSNAWTILYSILSGGVLLFGYLAAQVASPTCEEKHFYAMMLALVPTVLSLVLGQLNYALHFFFFRMLEIAEDFKLTDFWHRWRHLLEEPGEGPGEQPVIGSACMWLAVTRYAGSFPFVIALYTGTLFSPCYILARFGDLLGKSFLFALVMVPINLWLTYKTLVPSGCYRRIKNDYYSGCAVSGAPRGNERSEGDRGSRNT